MNNITCEEKRQGKSEWTESSPVANGLEEIVCRPLRQVDIIVAIQYYGIMELLDHIGVTEIERYVASR